MKKKLTNTQSALLSAAFTAALMASISLPISAVMADERSAGEVVDDISIAAQTKTALAADTTTDAIKIDVEVDHSNVQLNGFVDSEAERARAEEIVKGINGVASVENNLKIQPRDRSTGEYVDDKVLIAEVKAALADDPIANALSIDIEANQGVISLGGHVDTAAEREAAYKAAVQVAGVVKVINNLDVRS